MNDRIDTDRGRIAKPDPFNPRSPKRFGKILSNAANVKCKNAVEKLGFQAVQKVQMRGVREIDERRRIY